MAGLFSKIAKWGLIGVGSVLSLIPGVGAAIGAPLIVAGNAVKTNSLGNSPDKVASYAGQLQTTMQTAGAMQSAGQQPQLSLTLNTISAWVQKNFVLILIGFAAIFILPKLIGRRR